MGLNDQQHYSIAKLKALAEELGRVPRIDEFLSMLPRLSPDHLFGSYDKMLRAAGLLESEPEGPKPRAPKILTIDIETKPLKVYTFGIRDQYINPEQIIEDWSVMSWAAKWVGNDEVMYQDLSLNNDYTKDEIIIYGIWELMNEADVIIGQNSIRFDIPKLNGKFEKYKLGPPRPYKSVDTYRIKKKLGLTSSKLEYSTEYYNERFKKLKHSKFAGFSLWSECLKGNAEAWAEMKKYNIHDVLATEELYLNTLAKWDNSINYGVYTGVKECCPTCGGTNLEENDFIYTKTGAYKGFICLDCKSNVSSKQNELPSSLTKTFLK